MVDSGTLLCRAAGRMVAIAAWVAGAAIVVKSWRER